MGALSPGYSWTLQDYNECMFNIVNIVKVALGWRQMEYDTWASYAWARFSARHCLRCLTEFIPVFNITFSMFMMSTRWPINTSDTDLYHVDPFSKLAAENISFKELYCS
ncbi:hypothetical protein H5410_025844 [Solanum commersonii]|uniref:Uncharacterized protein n=1 Tax=Solanum commersonii TaxID=4109 RepID=A0A9J5YX12_SOLCO|nr:hypothetical protein H5410_025844 [Solanum commersonii]